MPTKQTKIILIIGDKLLHEVDRFRFENWISSRSEAIRKLLEEGLKANPSKLPKKLKS
jgi:metal-responsive CopG/Arc/MetJ family transcriptional regulator